jgi:hypothetical protein
MKPLWNYSMWTAAYDVLCWIGSVLNSQYQWPCDLRHRSVALDCEIASLNPSESMDVCLLCMLCR